MAKADRAGYQHSGTTATQKSYAKRMCNAVASALVVHTLMLIFVTSPTMEKSESIFPYFLLVIFVGLAILPLRNLERRWQALEKSELSDSSLATRFTLDRTKLWVAAIALPIIYAIIISAVSVAF